nr:hypothetical protein [Desulfovibrio sp. ZJ369]
MGEMVDFLYGQIVVIAGLKQLFGRPFVAVHDLHDFRIAAVHARAVAHFIHGFAVAVDAEERSFRLVVCRKGKALMLFRLRHNGSRLRLFSLCGGNGFLPHVVLDVFRPYFLDLRRHYIEERQLARIVCLLAPSGHVSVLVWRTGRRRMVGLPVIVFRLGEFQLFSVFNKNPPVFLKENNLVPFLDAELLPDFAGKRELAARGEPGQFHAGSPCFLLPSIILEVR